MLIIKHVYGRYDVFSGVGYDLHSRIALVKDAQGKKVVKHIDGERLPKAVCAVLLSSLDRKAHYQKIND